MKTGKNNNTGVGRMDGAVRELTIKDKLQQVVNLGQPMIVNGAKVTVDEALVLLDLERAHDKLNELIQAMVIRGRVIDEDDLREIRDLIGNHLR